MSHPSPAPALRAPSVLALAWKQTLRDFRAGELRLLVVAVMLAVAALTAVGFFADRLHNGLTRDARQLLGGDAVVSSDKPTPSVLRERAEALGLQAAMSTSFPSMGRAPDERGGASRLVAVKAVTPAYPLRGQVVVASVPGGAGEPAAGGPAPGTVWVDPALLDALQLRVGDPLLLGDATLTIARLIVVEPDRGAGFMSFAPRVMLAQADLEGTGLIQPASRVSYRFAVAAPPGRESAVREFVAFADERIKGGSAGEALRGVRVESLQSGRPEMQQTLDRAQKFLNLVALLAALLAAVAVGTGTSTTARCCACSASRSAASPASTSWSSPSSGSSPARWGWRAATRSTTCSCGCSPGWSMPPCPPPRCGRRCSGSASA